MNSYVFGSRNWIVDDGDPLKSPNPPGPLPGTLGRKHAASNRFSGS